MDSISRLKLPELPKVWESPFEPGDKKDAEETHAKKEIDEDIQQHTGGGISSYPTRRIWSDLLLDVSMTTAFNSLTNGTEVLDPETCISYLFFFTLVWWIWTSQICYDVRFIKADWVHRLSVFLQFIIFCALATFTKDFDIGYQISSSAATEEKKVEGLKLQAGFDDKELAAAQYRENWIPILNARGISVVMMLSRLLLMSQYLLTLFHAYMKGPPFVQSSSLENKTTFTRIKSVLSDPSFRSFHTHIISLTLSSISYFIASVILHSSVGQDRGAQIAKIFLWYLPITIEVGALSCIESKGAPFIIILGSGLDHITEGFQLTVGNVAIGKSGAGLIFSGAIAFITQFSLYFEMTKGYTVKTKEIGNCRRALAWFMVHFVYFSSLIVMLQAIAALLKFGDVGKALNLPLEFFSEANAAILKAGSGQNITTSDFHIGQQVEALGIELDDLVSVVNVAISSVNTSTSNSSISDPSDSDSPPIATLQVACNAALQGSAILIVIILDNFELSPDLNSELEIRLDRIIYALPDDPTLDFYEAWYQVASLAFTTNALPSLWFYGSAGLTLISLSVLGLIKWWNDLAVLSIRSTTGIITCLLSFVDIGQSNMILQLTKLTKTGTKSALRLTGAPVWSLASDSTLVPIFSIIVVCEQLAEIITIFVIRKRYYSQATSGTNRYIDAPSYHEVGHEELYDS